MFRTLAVTILLFAAATTAAQPALSVDCDKGQSLNRTLAVVNKINNHDLPATLIVKGSCTEYVSIIGFDGLRLKGHGATLVQPLTDPSNGLTFSVLSIESSRSVTIEGFTIHSRASAAAGVNIGRSSIDVRLRDLVLDGPAVFGIQAFENSQASLARVTARDPGYATVGVLDKSDVHIEDCLFESTTGSAWHAGIHVGTGHVTMHGTTIRNMQQGINVSAGGVVDIVDFNSYYPLGGNTDVVIDSPAETNFAGVAVGNGSSLNIGSARLVILKPGQWWGGATAGVFVTDGGTLNVGSNAGADLVISGSFGSGVFVSNNSHATLGGSSIAITGSGHGGLVAVNQSTINVARGSQISGNVMDVFCDPRSLITGTTNIIGAGNINCANLQPFDFDVLP